MITKEELKASSKLCNEMQPKALEVSIAFVNSLDGLTFKEYREVLYLASTMYETNSRITESIITIGVKLH